MASTIEPDLVLSDIHLFLKIKEDWEGQHYALMKKLRELGEAGGGNRVSTSFKKASENSLEKG